jgi:hypothetical protein
VCITGMFIKLKVDVKVVYNWDVHQIVKVSMAAELKVSITAILGSVVKLS